VQVQYEEHALQTDATELSNSSLYSTAEMRYASLPSPHIRGPLVFSNHKNTHDHCYHTIPINVHYFLIVNKDIYFKKSSFLLIIDKILANIIYLPLLKKKYKKSHWIKKKNSLVHGIHLEIHDQISDNFPATAAFSLIPQIVR
jgi:hypothetical protein